MSSSRKIPFKPAFVIAGKDLRNVFVSPLIWVVGGVCTVVWSFVFATAIEQFMRASVSQMMQGGESGINLHRTIIAYHVSLVNLLLIMSTAALTMRLLSEEKKQRTFDLLLTSPVTAAEIALGKWMAGTAMTWSLLLISALYPISLSLFGSLEWGPLLSAYLCMMMLTGVYVALGLFASSLTESAVVAVIIAIMLNFMLFFIGAPGQNAESPITKAIFEQMNIGAHLNTFVNGSFSVAGATFFVSLIVLFILLTQRVVESARWR